MHKQLLIFAFILAFLTGCATRQPITSADKQTVKAVVVNKDVPVPEKMYYLGQGGAAGMAFGLVGAVAVSMDQSKADAQHKALRSDELIKKIVMEEVTAKIRESGKMPLSETAAPGASTLNLSVLQYGFSVPTAFSSKVVPILMVKCELQDSTGRILWSATDRTMPLGNPVEAIDPTVIDADPAAREAAWRSAAKAVANSIVDHY
jgi:hypothetical protein